MREAAQAGRRACRSTPPLGTPALGNDVGPTRRSGVRMRLLALLAQFGSGE
ncbi:MAG TPA: hypothetical protein VGO16_08605 [Pseudonocardiaceae bacterium]|nr:hypothetical protein [Pseudonocardiaceae bacterium]